jgi:phospholipid/cholesterol/gamma-HCH transport system substrate-binding protein
MAKIDSVVPSLLDGKADELFEKVKSIRELAESFNKRSAALMQEGRRSLLDISQAAQKVTRKFDAQPAAGATPPSPPRNPNQKKRQ